MATDSLCLENIDEFINDENKIVTCKWLSLNLKIHINQAKRQLHTFLQQQRQKEKDITATYFLAGLVKGDNGSLEHMCQVVAEEDLELARAQLEAVTSCHVYSIQRAKLMDSNSLYMTDYEGVKEHLSECNKYTSIHCKRASVPRSRPGRGKTQTDKSQKDTTHSKGSNLNTKKDNVGSGDKPDTAAPSSGKGKKTAPKGSLEAMFAQSNKKAENDGNRKKEDHSKEESKENKPAHKKGSVLDMFANAKPAAKTKAPEEKAKPDKTVTKEKPEGKDTKTQGKKFSKKTPRQTDDSDSEDRQQKKKRRRIQNDLFDSSSEEEDVELIPPSPEPSPMKEDSPEPESPVPSKKSPTKQVTEKPHGDDDEPAPGGKLRRRKKKLVPKTYLDDEGFMVTEKVWETESTDASEVDEDTQTKPPPPKKPASSPAKNTKKPSPQKKKGSPAKGKQASIMSFFKKQ